MQNASPSLQARNYGPMRNLLIWLAAGLSVICIGAPLAVIFASAFSKGVDVFFSEILKPETLHAIWLTILTAIVVVPINMVFGVCVAWLVTKFRFPGRRLLITFVEIPFSVSPIVAGVTYLFLYGSQGLLGPLLESYDIKIMFTVPAIFLVSLFVTSPFVARELIPLMEVQGSDEEEAALTLGANAWQTFFYVTLPNIKWALLYGAVLCNARVMGEFGATSVVSGAIRGKTNTLPLQVELLFNDYNVAGAFAAASTLALIALLTLVLKILLERRQAT
ncbi:sulfate ABC transporter permease subunit CysW [Ochrobactrum sp. CGA5]|uniref:sulfate ABC transporter permease subunit CysW n=1 Tax=Ochrobactrum sp. CGA5 TaxID=2583453 RepID=UPI00111D3310|nr:sulfate ABC transporter permease subunit CysW [Ochrobactrum sp. CGA5]